jgi:amino acid adenylation domain-containing protein
MAIELRGVLDKQILERALGAIVNRHESLRTVFTVVDGRPLQMVSEPGVWMLPVTDLSGELKPREQMDKLLRQEVSRGFDLEKGPLFRARLYRLATEHYVLLLAMHHIISDGWSLGILFRELGELYGCLCQGKTPNLPALRFQYRDYAHWEGRWLKGEGPERLLGHWRSRLAGAPQVLELPADHPRPAMESNRGASYSFTLPPKLLAALHGFACRERATLFMVLLAGYNVLLSRYSGQEDLLVGAPVANRNRLEIEDVVGCFVNTLVLRADLSGDPSVSAFLARLREVCFDAFEYQDLPFERLVEEMRPPRDLSRNPLVQVMLAMENMPLRTLEQPGLSQALLELDPGVSHVDLMLLAQETSDGLTCVFEYATDLFEAPTIARMATHWRSVLEAMVESPKSRLSELPLLTAPERQRLLVEWNSATVNYQRDLCVHERFEMQAKRTPETIAVTCEDKRLSYADLDRRANQIAHHLRKLGVGAGARVGLCVERSLEMVVGLLGILKSGAAYVPLDPSFPLDRLRFMTDDARLALLVSTAASSASFEVPRERLVLFDEDANAIAAAPDTRLPADTGSARGVDPAYVIYTSGSTGKPKGVVVPHRAIVNLLSSMSRTPGLEAEDVLLAVTTLSFDIAVLELLLPITVGAKAVIARKDQMVDGDALGKLLEQENATVMQATPVTWRLLLEAGWKPRRGFKALVGGETLTKSLADRLIALGIEVWNLYGPTETTVWSTCGRITDTVNGISIGRPIDNTTIRILDARKNLCPIGVPGELCIGGDGVCSGYWNRPELTAERFVVDPFGTTPEARLYCTGDRARWRNDGTLEHLGRLDHQLKLRGFRIEPGEIETAIGRHPAVREVVVIAREDSPEDKRLAAYLVAENPPEELADQLRALVRATLPEYMVPAHFVLLDTLPRTPNGKIDRNSLPAPRVVDSPTRRVADLPRNPTEEMVMGTFRHALNRTDFGVFDSFFDLGGHSLMAARLMLMLRAASGIDLPLRLLFERPTAAALSGAVEELAWLEKSKTPINSVGGREEIEV